jgi:hypothetical protein
LSGAFLIAGTLAGSRFGAAGVAAGMSIGAALAAPAYLYILARQFVTSVATILREIGAPLLATLAMAVAVFTIHRQLPAERAAFDLAVLVLSGVVSFPLALVIVSGSRLKEDLRWLLAAKGEAAAMQRPAVLTEEPLS